MFTKPVFLAATALVGASSIILAVTVPSAEPHSAAMPAGQDWNVNFGEPGQDGQFTIEVQFEYTDDQGVRKEKTVSATASITDSMSASTKRQAVQNALNDALANPENMAGGTQQLGTTSSGTDSMTISPGADGSAATDIEIEGVDTKDKTNENDKVNPPPKESLGVIQPRGDLTGSNGSGGSSNFSATTSAGTVSVALTGSMTKAELLQELANGLDSQGLTVWIDSRAETLFARLPASGGPVGLGSSTSDRGLEAFTKVITSE